MKVRMKGLLSAFLTLVFMLSCTLFVFADTAVVTTSDGGSVNMRAEASTDSDVVNFLDDGTEVEVLGTEGDWTQVSYDGYTGYVMSTYLEISSEDTAAEDTTADTDTAADTAAEDTASEDTAAIVGEEDTTADAVEESDTEDTGTDTEDSDSEKLAQYKKLVMILGLICVVLLIIIINLLLFYRRGYDDDDYDDDEDDDDEEEEEERPRRARREKNNGAQQYEYEPIRVSQDTRELETPDISSLVEPSATEAQGKPAQSADKKTYDNISSDSDELEFFDLDDL